MNFHKTQQVDKALQEQELNIELSENFFAGLLKSFPDTEILTHKLLNIREQTGLIDLKRGELYPEVIGYSSKLREAISQIYEVNVPQAQPNFGCNGCIDTFFAYIQRLQLTEGDYEGFVAAVPTYFRYYHKAQALNFNLLGIPFNDDGSYPINNVLSTVKEQKISFLLLVSPNNPTGVPLSNKELIHLLNEIPEDLIVALDRTCVNIENEISTKQLLKDFSRKKLVIFHSFSKYHGLSHQRIGFSLFSNPQLATEVEKYLPFGLNLQSVLLAIDILLKEGELKPCKRILNNITENRLLMKEFLEKNNEYACSNFKGNYAVLTLPETISTQEFYRRLINQKMSVMPGHQLPVVEKRSIRIHCGGYPPHFEKMIQEIESWKD